MDFRTEGGRGQYDELVVRAADIVVGLDFDGTLSPIVSDPTRAKIHPAAPRALVSLAGLVKAVAIVTGRPARQVVDLGHLGEVADELPADRHLLVRGQYGNEQWDSATRAFTSAQPPEGLEAFRDELPDLLAQAHAGGARVEDKGLAVAVHTRELDDPQRAFTALKHELTASAARHGLSLEPGRLVLEVRAPGMHKGLAIASVIDEYDASGVLFVGDDLGDIEAFDEVAARREAGFPALLVCSSSDEEEALAERADLVVPGPEGVVELLHALADAAPAASVG